MKGVGWQGGYRSISCIQVCLTLGLVLTLGLWKAGRNRTEMDETGGKTVSAISILKRQGIVPTLCSFFCYCAVEQTAGLWAATYMVMVRGIPAERAALWASMFYVGITAGRLISGFISFRLTDTAMVWLGQCVMAVGIFCLFLPLGETMLCVGLVMTGLGCAPVYPGLLHDTPVFGEDISQVLMGMQMACAYVGTMLMPSLFGVLSNVLGLGFYPVYLLAVLVVMSVAFEMRGRILHRERHEGT